MDNQISVIETALFTEIQSKERENFGDASECNFGHVEIKVPKEHARRDVQQSTGSLRERAVLETDPRFISIYGVLKLCVWKRSLNKTVVRR